MDSARIEIVIEPYKRIIIHETTEYKLTEWFGQILRSASSAGGTTIPSLQWCNGVVFAVAPFNPNSEAVIKEQLEGIVHYANVSFAIKEAFENEVRTSQGVVRLIDLSANENFVKLCQELKRIAKHSA